MPKPLTITQTRALRKLNNDWQCADELKEALPTLHGLVVKGRAIRKNDLGSLADPRAGIYFKLKP